MSAVPFFLALGLVCLVLSGLGMWAAKDDFELGIAWGFMGAAIACAAGVIIVGTLS